MRLSFASLKHCMPKGMPTMVMQKKTPIMAGLQGQGDAADEQPQDVQQQGNPASTQLHLLAEGEKGQLGKFEALHAPWDADDGNAP